MKKFFYFAGECKMTGKGGEYRGTISTTRKGVKCQRWDEHFPHRHDSITPKKYPNSGLDENYCRNPDGEGLPWCYTSSNEQRWDYCDVPMCKSKALSYEIPSSYNALIKLHFNNFDVKCNFQFDFRAKYNSVRLATSSH